MAQSPWTTTRIAMRGRPRGQDHRDCKPAIRLPIPAVCRPPVMWTASRRLLGFCRQLFAQERRMSLHRIDYEVKDRIAVVAMSRRPVNAIDHPMIDAIHAALRRADA